MASYSHDSRPARDFAADATQTEEAELLPLELFFGPSEGEMPLPLIAPDGKHLANLAPYDGVSNIFVCDPDAPEDARPVTASTRSPIRGYAWAYNSSQLIYRVDEGGDERYRYFAVDIHSGETIALSPERAAGGWRVSAWGAGYYLNHNSSPAHPDEILLAMDDRIERINDIYLVNTRTGERRRLAKGSPRLQRWLADPRLRVRGRVKALSGGGWAIELRESATGTFAQFLRFAHGDFQPYLAAQFSHDGHRLYLIESRGRDTAALVEYDTRSGKSKIVAADPEVDAGHSLVFRVFHPGHFTPQAVYFCKDRIEWQVVDPAVKADFAFLAQAIKGDFNPYDSSFDDRLWMICAWQDDKPGGYYLYDRGARTLKPLFHWRPELLGKPLVKMQPIRYSARDGLMISGYLSLPRGFIAPGPLVLNVHGGPNMREYWGFDPVVQWLANRGYACLQVNFRGSLGLGKRFMSLGDREWGGKMQDDLTDAVRWAIAEGIADPRRVAIFGESYGGYAVLAGLAFTPELYACGVAINGVSDLIAELVLFQAYRPSSRADWVRRVGRVPVYTQGERRGQLKDEQDWTDAERKEVEFLRSRSPLFHAHRVRAPLLIAHGARDTRGSIEQSTRIVKALRRRGVEVEHVMYEDEGHWLARPETYLDLYRRAEKFLARHLGGRRMA